jgi:ParB/RepB/Spo0J family partition protein
MSVPELKYVPIAQLIESTTNYRRRHDELAHRELVASIESHGILTPLIVRQVTQDAVPLYEVAAGHRRLRAARAASVTAVPVVVRTMDDREFADIMFTENLQRVDPDPLDEADGYQAMIDTLDYDVATLAQRFGKGETYIRHRLVLTQAGTATREALARGAIELGHAVLLARVSQARQDELLTTQLLSRYGVIPAITRESVVDESQAADWDEDPPAAAVMYPTRTRLTVGELRQFMGQALLPLAPVKWDQADATLVPSAGACTTCPKRTGANPMLFTELDSDDDRCSDAGCYAGKRTAWLTQRVVLTRVFLPKLVVVSESSSRQLMPKVDGLTALAKFSEWTVADHAQRGTVPAIVVGTSYGSLDDWETLGALIDVKLVPKKEPAKRKTPGHVRRSWQESRAADDRFWVGVRGVVRAMVASSIAPVDQQPLLCALLLAGQMDEVHGDLLELLREECGDVTATRAEVRALAPETLRDQAMLVAAAVLVLGLETPFRIGNTDPEIEEATETYAMPAALSDLAATVAVDALTVWRAAILADHADDAVPSRPGAR